MSLQLHRPDERGALKPEPGPPPDYRDQLRSPRWGRRAHRARLPALRNPEMRPSSRLIAVAFWLGLARATFVADRARVRLRLLAVPGLTPLGPRGRSLRIRIRSRLVGIGRIVGESGSATNPARGIRQNRGESVVSYGAGS